MQSDAPHLVERVAARLRNAGNSPMAHFAEPAHAIATDDAVVDLAPPVNLPPNKTAGPAHQISLADLARAGLAIGGGARSRISEESRITAERLSRSLKSAPSSHAIPNLMMITSTSPGEGKTFTSVNIAASLAKSSLANVLIIDTDPKLKSLSTVLSVAERPGLLELAANPALKPEDLIIQTEIPGLTMLPFGLSDAVNADRGITRHISLAIERVARGLPHSIVILDAPPCLSTSDPSALAPLVSQIAMVVEAGRTQRSEFESAVELLHACSNIVLILNKVRVAAHAFGAYDYFSVQS